MRYVLFSLPFLVIPILFFVFLEQRDTVRAKVIVDPSYFDCSENILASTKITCKRSPKSILVEFSGYKLNDLKPLLEKISFLVSQYRGTGDFERVKAEFYLDELKRIRQELFETEVRIKLIEDVLKNMDYLAKKDNIPPLDEIKDIFETYKELKMKRTEILMNHTEKSPYVKTIDKQIEFTVRAMKSKLNYVLKNLKMKKKVLLDEYNALKSGYAIFK